jgi:hypothetical protein
MRRTCSSPITRTLIITPFPTSPNSAHPFVGITEKNSFNHSNRLDYYNFKHGIICMTVTFGSILNEEL